MGPWSVEVDIDYNSSIFDSQFLSIEYVDFLDQIGLVPAMAANVKANLGRVPLILEWNGAIEDVNFTDDADRRVSMRPGAWQISTGYQFDWNPWLEAAGAKGTYLALTYSQSYDLAGATDEVAGEMERIGTVPEQKFLAHAGEWIFESTRIALEYSYIVDYSVQDGGTGKSASAVFSTLTYEW